jgi:hypothetical protein
VNAFSLTIHRRPARVAEAGQRNRNQDHIDLPAGTDSSASESPEKTKKRLIKAAFFGCSLIMSLSIAGGNFDAIVFPQYGVGIFATLNPTQIEFFSAQYPVDASPGNSNS